MRCHSRTSIDGHHCDVAALGVGAWGGRHDLRRCGRLFTDTERSNGLQQLEPRPKREPKLAQVLIGEITKHVRIDRIVAKTLRVLLQTDPAEPTVDVQVQSPGLL